ncbi:tetratricopeptide repeat protein [Robbsia sp. Bb-Pol-6]|uniref:Tetratricopeptide repeat protein n=1 Tax=Robbsia betulipollinis TaxID=2981849 RepID=A0ABT3ZND5_9BURK|nr:tetratricopeptide repeat protein [Robbsia betulipollinis]MCY0388039.1 tetratricopeptide repeat protein [Robbsia betulipollinis]
MKTWLIRGALCASMLTASLSPSAFAASPAPSVQDVEQAINRGDLQGAQSMLDQVVAAHPGSARAHYLDAQVLERNHRYGDALTQLDAARRIDPALGFTDRAKFETVQRRISAEAQAGTRPATSIQSFPNAGESSVQPAAPVHRGPSPIAWLGLLIVLAAVVGLIVWSMRRRRQQDDVGATDMHRAALKRATELLDSVRAVKLDLKLSTSPDRQTWVSDAEDVEAQLSHLIDTLGTTGGARGPETAPAYQLEELDRSVERLKALAAGRPDPQAGMANASPYAGEANRMAPPPYQTPYGQQPYGQQPGSAPWGNQPVQQQPQGGMGSTLGAGLGGLAAGVVLGEIMGGHRERDVVVERDNPAPPFQQADAGNTGGAVDFGNGNDSWSDGGGQIDAGNADDNSWDDNA